MRENKLNFHENPINQRFTEVIKFLLNERKFRQNEISEKIGISEGGLSRLIKLKGNVLPEHIAKLMEHFSANPYFILLGIGEKIQQSKTDNTIEVREDQSRYVKSQEELVETQRKYIMSLEAQVESIKIQKKSIEND